MAKNFKGSFPNYLESHEIRTVAYTAGGGGSSVIMWQAIENCRIKSVNFFPDSAITGQNTNYETIIVAKNNVNQGAGVAFTLNTNAAARGTVAAYAPATPAQTVAGDIWNAVISETGGGMNMPAGLWQIVFDFEP